MPRLAKTKSMFLVLFYVPQNVRSLEMLGIVCSQTTATQSIRVWHVNRQFNVRLTFFSPFEELVVSCLIVNQNSRNDVVNFYLANFCGEIKSELDSRRDLVKVDWFAEIEHIDYNFIDFIRVRNFQAVCDRLRLYYFYSRLLRIQQRTAETWLTSIRSISY